MRSAPSLHCRAEGAGSPLVLLHGWAFDHRVWLPVIPALAERRRVLALDLPGHGASPDPAERLGSLLDALERSAGGPADWIGWSLGGLLALQLAADRPQLVRRLLVVGAGPRFAASEDWPHGVDPALLAEFAAGLADDRPRTLRRFGALLRTGAPRGQPLRLRTGGSDRGLLWGLRLLGELDLRAALSGALPPTGFLFGGRDPLVPASLGAALRLGWPRLRVTSVAEAGHLPFLTHPQAFLAAAGDLLD